METEAPTVIDKPMPIQALSKQATPTVIDKPMPIQAISNQATPTVIDKPMPIQAISMKAPPIQTISMKTPGTHERPAAPDNPPTPMLARPKLRAVSEVTPAADESAADRPTC